MTEQWKPVLGFEGLYEVSDLGRVRSLDRTTAYKDGRVGHHTGRLMTPSIDEDGRPRVALSNGGRTVIRRVHRIVLETFVGPRPEGMQACHWDDDRTNNCLSNLRWGTRSDNALDAVRNGRHNMAKKTRCPEGHEYNEENTHTAADGRRTCRICARAKTARWRARQTEKLGRSTA